MIYPIKDIAITQGYHTGKRLDFGWWTKHHQDVMACDDGKVYKIEKQPNGGNVIYLKHSGDIISVYAHLDTIVVKKGQVVAMGEKIATMGASGKVTGEHLHFGLYSKGKNIYGNADLDPFKYCLVYPNQKVADSTIKKYGSKIKYYDDKKVWDKGIYILLYDKYLRKDHNLGMNVYKVNECPKSFLPYLTSIKPNNKAQVKKGSDVNILDIYNENGRIWGVIIAGNKKYYVVLCNKDGKEQAKKC